MRKVHVRLGVEALCGVVFVPATALYLPKDVAVYRITTFAGDVSCPAADGQAWEDAARGCLDAISRALEGLYHAHGGGQAEIDLANDRRTWQRTTPTRLRGRAARRSGQAQWVFAGKLDAARAAYQPVYERIATLVEESQVAQRAAEYAVRQRRAEVVNQVARSRCWAVRDDDGTVRIGHVGADGEDVEGALTAAELEQTLIAMLKGKDAEPVWDAAARDELERSVRRGWRRDEPRAVVGRGDRRAVAQPSRVASAGQLRHRTPQQLRRRWTLLKARSLTPMTILLGGEGCPLALSVHYLDAPIDVVVPAIAGIWSPMKITKLDRSLPQSLEALLPFEAPWTRMLAAQAGSWTAVVNNFVNGGDSTAPGPAVAGELDVRCVVAEHAPPYGPGHAATQLTVEGSGGEGPLRTIRSLSAHATDGRWTWYESGSPFEFEETARYAARRKRDRFDRDLLLNYLAALDIPVDDSAFGPATLLQQRFVRPRRKLTLDEARATFGL